MKKFITYTFALFTILTLQSFNNCDKLLYFKVGSSFTMVSYDKIGEKTGSFKTDIISVQNSDTSFMSLARSETFDNVGKAIIANNYKVKCYKGLLSFDMIMMMPPESASNKSNMDITMEGTDMTMPVSLYVGDT